MVFAGLSIGVEAIKSIISGDYKDLSAPGMLALIAAIVSILSKAAMFLYTRKHARSIKSTALMAEAWDHLSDALSSVGALIGIGGSMLGIPVMEPLASIIICLMIIKAAIDIFREALDQMMDRSAGAEKESEIRDCILKFPEVRGIDLLHTRMFGNKIYVDIEIRLDSDLTLIASHEIAEKIHDSLESRFSQIKHVMIHVNPE